MGPRNSHFGLDLYFVARSGARPMLNQNSKCINPPITISCSSHVSLNESSSSGIRGISKFKVIGRTRREKDSHDLNPKCSHDHYHERVA